MPEAESLFAQTFRSTTRIHGLTHDFYRYPARFDPVFIRYVLEALTEPGDWVLDPFMGGGTTIVEALSMGRGAIGSDINDLARFVTRVKTTPLSKADAVEIKTWTNTVVGLAKSGALDYDFNLTPIKNLPPEVYPFFATAMRLSNGLRFRRRRMFALCALVSVGQWALDGTRRTPDTLELAEQLYVRVGRMLRGLDDLVSAARDTGTWKNRMTRMRHIRAYSSSDSNLASNLKRRAIQPKLIITSPPYPGVHVLYHRWQVFGRRETPAPFWIANLRDGQGEAFYTMGGRSQLGIARYFRGLTDSFTKLSAALHPRAYVVQLISFSHTKTQLPRYRDAMTDAGFEETSVGDIESGAVRTVPNRRWFNHSRQLNDSSNEFVLVHRLRRNSHSGSANAD